MQTESLQETKQDTLTFYNQKYYELKQATEAITKLWQEHIDTLDPAIIKLLPSEFEHVDIEQIIKKHKVSQLPNFQSFETAGIDLTTQVKLTDVEKSFVDLVKHERMARESVGFAPYFHKRATLKKGKISFGHIAEALDSFTLTLTGLDMEVYLMYQSIVEKVSAVNPTILTEYSNKLEKILPLSVIVNAPDWLLDGEKCVVNPSAVQSLSTI